MTKASHQAFQKRHHHPEMIDYMNIWATACSCVIKAISSGKELERKSYILS
jgi:hypothetical protein